MGTLWASNGGALIAALSAEKMLNQIGIFPLICFGVGIVLSIVMGLINLVYCSRSLIPIGELNNLFVIGSTVGDFDPDQVAPLIDRINRSTIFKWPLWASGFGSLASFIVGAVTGAVRILG